MDYDKYKESLAVLQKSFGDKMHKLEIHHLMGHEDDALRDSMREDCRTILSEMFAMMDQLEPINKNKQTLAQVLADYLGVKGEKREELISRVRKGERNV